MLIAILIFGLGMLGMVGLLAATAKYQSGNQARLQISNAVESIGERIRANYSAANGYSGVNPVTNAPVAGIGYNYTATYATQNAASVPAPTVDCKVNACNQVQREAYDVLEWRRSLKQSIPGGAGLISGSVRTGFNVTVMWFDKTAVQGDDVQFTDTLQSSPVCVAGTPPNSPDAKFCCPQAAGNIADLGIRCFNTTIIP